MAHSFAFPQGRPVLALGAFLKATVCAAASARAEVSETFGDLDTAPARRALETAARAMAAGLGRPAVITHDLHPDFPSTHLAQRLGEAWDVPTLAVQHHHAHAAAVAVEHGLVPDAPFLALTLDGFGLGSDGGAWGGELLRIDGPRFARLGYLAPLAQPGGDAAARAPWRMAAAALHRLGRGPEIAARFADQPAAALLAGMLDRGLNCPPTSSAGRLFDAACGLLGVHPVAAFEGQAPMALEAMVTAPRVADGAWTIGPDGVLDLLPLLDALSGLDDARTGAEVFHGTLAAALAAWAIGAAEANGLRSVALCGGCFLNRVLTTQVVAALQAADLHPLTLRTLPPGDQSISLGQAWVGALAGDL